jgi:hypothetical protein
MEQEDIDFVNKQLEEANMNDKTEYKLSWTKKVGESYHKASGDTVEEVKKNMQDLESMISSLSTPTPVVAQPPAQFTPPTTPVPTAYAGGTGVTKYTCNICGGPMDFIDAVSKAGRPYKMLKCKAFPELVNNKKGVEGHSRFI